MSTLTYDPSTQRLQALSRANDVRMRRAELKRDIAACRVPVAAVLADPEWWLASMWVIDLLLAAPRCGRAKATEALKRAGCSPRARVGELTERQQAVLVRALEPRARH